MHELMDSLVHQLIVQLGESIQRESDIGIDHTQECGRISAVSPLHVAMILSRAQEQVF